MEIRQISFEQYKKITGKLKKDYSLQDQIDKLVYDKIQQVISYSIWMFNGNINDSIEYCLSASIAWQKIKDFIYKYFNQK